MVYSYNHKKKKSIAITNFYPDNVLFLAVDVMHGPWGFLFSN